MSVSSASDLVLLLLDPAPLQLEREGIKKIEDGERGGGGRLFEGGDLSRDGHYSRTVFFGVMVEYNNPVTSELPTGLCYGEERSSWLANRWWCCYDLKE